MKKRVCISLIVLCFAVFAILSLLPEKTYTVLEVLEGDKFYIDLNSDGKKGTDEVFHLKDVNTFPLYPSKKAYQYAVRYGITIEEALAAGLGAKEFSKEKLEGKKVRVTEKIPPLNPAYSYRFTRISLEGKDYGEVLIKEGLAFAYGWIKPNRYKKFEDVRKIRNRAKLFLQKFPSCGQKSVHKDTQEGAFQVSERGKTAPYALSHEKKFKNVTFFLINPNNLKKPSDKCLTSACRALIKNINTAKTSIDMALYGIDRQDEVIEALLAAKARGVEIRAVVDSKPGDIPAFEDTARLKTELGAVCDSKAALMHNKFFIFDDSRVFTGTMNISNTGSGGYNANTALIIDDKQTALIYKKEFEQLYSGVFQGAKRDFSSKISLNPDTELSIFFSPVGKAYENGILPLIRGAKSEIFVSIFYLTHKGIIEELRGAKQRGVDVRILYDAVGAQNMREKVRYLRESGIRLKVENWGGKDHEKNMVIDGKYFITGSANFSYSGMNKNDENVLIFKSPAIAGFYRDYFLKLYNSLNDRCLKFIPRAESFESGNSCHDGIDNNFDGKIDYEDAGCMEQKY